MFVPGKPFQPSLMIEPPQMKHLSSAPIQGKLLASRTIIRLGWKGLPRTKTVAYHDHSLNYVRKKYCNVGSSGQCYKTFYGRNCVAIGITVKITEKYAASGVITAVKSFITSAQEQRRSKKFSSSRLARGWARWWPSPATASTTRRP